MQSQYSLIAHRGQPADYPENSLEGFEHVLKSGAKYVETDINITLDGIPVLSHDDSISKLTGQEKVLSQIKYDDLKNIQAGNSKRFANKFKHCRIARLNQFSKLIENWPDSFCFIELKQASIDQFSLNAVDIAMRDLQSIQSQIIIISYNYEVLNYAREKYKVAIGWVLPQWSEQNRKQAMALKPEYLFLDTDFYLAEKTQLWLGSWQWVCFTVNTQQELDYYSNMGFSLIETNCFSALT